MTFSKLISGILRHGISIAYVVDLVNDLNLYDKNINTWKNGIVRSLKHYISNGMKLVNKKRPQSMRPQRLDL
ncbi:MAG: hypothetical protein ACMUEM_05850 [Flavobacteriales bacterium AspAUS03]